MQESNISNHSLIQILGKSQRSRQWRAFRKEVRELPSVQGHGPGRAIFYEFVNNGIDIAFSKEGRVSDVSFWGPAALHYSESIGFVQLCQLQLPGRLTLEDKKAEMLDKLGQPVMSAKRKPPINDKYLPHKEAMRQIRNQKETIEEEIFVVDDISIICSFDSLQRGHLLSITFKTLGDRQKAEIYQTSGRYREAIALLEKCLHKTPYDFLVMSELAVCHGKLQEFAQAEKYFQTAITSPLLEGVVVTPFHLGYADLLEKLGRFDDACEQLLIVYREQERREDEQREVILQRLKKLETRVGITNKNLKKQHVSNSPEFPGVGSR
ncbi:MAG: tetratricopeptide repeat protein [Cyanobacteria bacterium SZAS-4]|nr:tetratricopeptide repeat protein [Cyanobacteria bacterium SZAS-4]